SAAWISRTATETWSIMKALANSLTGHSGAAKRRPGMMAFSSRRRPRLHQLVDDRIHQRLERGVDDVGGHADRGPVIAVLVGALDEHARHRLCAGVEDADSIIGEFEPGDVALILAEVLAQREVERVDRAFAFGSRDQSLPADLHLHHRHAHGDALALGVDALLDIDVEFLHVEVARHLAEEPPRQE